MGATQVGAEHKYPPPHTARASARGHNRSALFTSRVCLWCGLLSKIGVCGSVLRCVAVCCSIWVCCSVLQCVAVCRSVLQSLY